MLTAVVRCRPVNIEVRHHHHYHGDGIGDGIWTLVLLLLLLPPLLPLIALEYYSWVFMAAHHWHPVFKGTVALAELCGVACALMAFCARASEKMVAWTPRSTWELCTAVSRHSM